MNAFHESFKGFNDFNESTDFNEFPDFDEQLEQEPSNLGTFLQSSSCMFLDAKLDESDPSLQLDEVF